MWTACEALFFLDFDLLRTPSSPSLVNIGGVDVCSCVCMHYSWQEFLPISFSPFYPWQMLGLSVGNL
jgi:hypothetical protein